MRDALRTKLFKRVPERLQPSARVLRIATAGGGMPWAARLRLLTVVPRVGRSGVGDVRVGLPGGPVFLGRESLYVDSMTLGYVWGERIFAPSCRDRVVVDLGAHKGYFAAWALANGAAHVHSVEPSGANYSRLEKAQRANTKSSSWTIERSAVGDAEGTVSLFVSAESWAHSIQVGMVDAVSVETVPMTTLADVLGRLPHVHRDRDCVLKVNVEGSAGSILLAASPDDLQRVVEIHLDHEPGSPYALEDVMKHLAKAGLDSVESLTEKIFVVRRRLIS